MTESLPRLAAPRFKPGDRVVKNPATWTPSEFDAWGAGEGIGVVMESPFPDDGSGTVDVRWPVGRAFQREDELLPAPPETV